MKNKITAANNQKIMERLRPNISKTSPNVSKIFLLISKISPNISKIFQYISNTFPNISNIFPNTFQYISKIFLLIPLYFLLSSTIIQTHTNAQTLDEYLIIAAENNPDLKSKYFRYQAALERVPQVGSLPDPQLSFSIFIMPMERYMGNQVAGISVMQMFPWFGARSAAKDEMAFMAKAGFEDFAAAKSTLFYEVRANWYALQLLENEIAIAKEDIELLKTMEQIAITRFKSGGQSGSGSMIDVLRVQMEINELQNSLELLEDGKVPVIARFNQLLNRDRNEPVILPDTILAAQAPVALDQIPDSIKSNNPMLKMLEQEEAAFMAQGEMNRKMGFPMIGVGLQYDIFRPRDNSESRMNGRNMLMPMATVSIPLWRKKYKASVKESDFMRQAVVEQRQDVANQLMVSYEDALKDYKDAARRVKLYQEQTSLANQVLNILIAQYTTEGSSIEEVLRIQQQLLDYRLKFLDALIDGNMAAAMMQRLMGR
jgi:outer membrane protein TolC